MDCRANLIGGMGLLIAALAGCAGQTSRSPGSEEFATADDSPRWRSIAVDAMPISIDSSLFTTAPFTQHHPSSGDFEGYGLAHFRDGNDRSIRIVYIINDEPLPMNDEDLMNANDYQAVALRVPPEDTSDVRILDRGTIDIWGGEMQYEFATERAYSGPALPPINITASDYGGLPGAEHRQCINFLWADPSWVKMLIGNICEYAWEVREPVSSDAVAMIIERLNIRMH